MPVSGIVLRHTIDELPVAEVSVQLGNMDQVTEAIQSSVAINTDTFRKAAGLLQEKIYNEFRVTPDVRLIVRDGNKDFKLEFNGFLARPEMVIREGQVAIKLAMVHAKASLQAWTGQIYSSVEPYVTPYLADAFGDKSSTDAQRGGKGKSVALKVLGLIEHMMNSVELAPTVDEISEFTMMPLHRLNLRALPVVKAMLLASESTTEIDGLSDDEFDPSNCYATLLDVLRNSQNFLAALKALSHLFMFQMNADWKGNLWLEPVPSLSDGTGNRVIQVPMEQVRFNMAHLYELPLQQVVVVGPGVNLYVFSGQTGLQQGEPPATPIPLSAGEFYSGRLPEDGDIWTRMQCIARYPEVVGQDMVGNFFVLNAPSWINADAILDSQLDLAKKDLDDAKDRFANSVAGQKAIQDNFLRASKPRNKLLSYMARQLFHALYLSGTYASITVPLDLRPCVGRRYQVQDLAGRPMFEGLLRDVHHEVSLGVESAASASTTLMFTHIVVAEAKLTQLIAAASPDAVVKQAMVKLPVKRTDTVSRPAASAPSVSGK